MKNLLWRCQTCGAVFERLTTDEYAKQCSKCVECEALIKDIKQLASMFSDVLELVRTTQDFWDEEDYAMLENAKALVSKHLKCIESEGKQQ